MVSAIQPIDVYIGAAIFGLFSGIGNVIGQWIWKKFLLPKVNGLHTRIKNKTKNKNNMRF